MKSIRTALNRSRHLFVTALITGAFTFTSCDDGRVEELELELEQCRYELEECQQEREKCHSELEECRSDLDDCNY